MRLRGEAGDDVLTGGTGADELSGGDDQDTLDYRDRTGGVCLSLWTEQRCYPGEPEGDAIGHDVERILLGDGPDMIYSGRWETPIAVYGGDGNDDLNVGGGHHVVSSGPGDDIVTVAGGAYGWADYVECSAGADKVYALWSDYVADDCETVQWASYYGYDMPWDATDRARRDADSWWINPATFTVPPPLAAGEPPDNWAERRKAYLEAHGLAGDVPAPALSALRGRGLAVGVQCAQACAFDARLTVSRATARRHRLGGTVIARTAGTRRGDQARIRLRPRAAVRRRLGKVRRLAVTLRLKAAGRPAAVQRLTLRG